MIPTSRTHPNPGILTKTIVASCLGFWAAAAPAAAQKPASRLVLQIHEVKCLDETNGKYIERVGGDEIALTGVAIGPDGEPVPLKTLKVGYFKGDGAVKRFSPARVFASFALRNAASSRGSYQAMLILVERDQGKSLDPLVDQIAKATKASLAASMSSGEPSTIALSLLGREAVGVAEKRIQKWLGDDLFPAQMAQFSMPGATDRLPEAKAANRVNTAVVEGNKGKYRIRYSWRLVG